MPTRVRIIAEDVLLEAEFFDSPCAQAVIDIRPIEAHPNVWGDEFYFEIPTKHPLDETATSHVAIGDIGYWPPGSALALFFGPTPLSRGAEPVPASNVNLVGRIIKDATALKRVKGAAIVRIERSDVSPSL